MIAPEAAVLGLVIGSFLNVVIYRVPRRRSVVWPASRCPNCGEPIAGKDDILLISYLVPRGRCRDCGERISPRYPMIEALTALLFGAGYRFGVSIELISALIALAAIEHGLRPNSTVGSCVVGYILSVLLEPAARWLYHISALAAFLGALSGAVVGGLLMGIGKIRRRSALPFGVFMAFGALVSLFEGLGNFVLYPTAEGV